MSRARYLAVRAAHTIFLLWVILTFLFFFFRLMPGSYVNKMLFAGASQETIIQFKEQWGLNEPLYIQYWVFLKNLAQGNMGMSLQYREPVWKVVRMRIFNTFILVGPAITLGYVFSGILGTVLGKMQGSRVERYGTFLMIMLGALPSFFLGIVMIIIFGQWLNVVPTSGMLSPGFSAQFSDASWWRVYVTSDFAWHYLLPFTTIILRYSYAPTTIMRTSVVEVARQDFSFYHKVTGLPYLNRMRHMAKHAALPLITLYPISMARAISGLVLLEIVFNWPGIGFTLVEAVFQRDTPIVQFVFFLVAAFVVLANFAVDIVYGIIDPRVTLGD